MGKKKLSKMNDSLLLKIISKKKNLLHTTHPKKHNLKKTKVFCTHILTSPYNFRMRWYYLGNAWVMPWYYLGNAWVIPGYSGYYLGIRVLTWVFGLLPWYSGYYPGSRVLYYPSASFCKLIQPSDDNSSLTYPYLRI